LDTEGSIRIIMALEPEASESVDTQRTQSSRRCMPSTHLTGPEGLCLRSLAYYPRGQLLALDSIIVT